MTKLDPVAGYVVKTTTLVGAPQKIFINLCVDPQIPCPEVVDLTAITARVMQGQDWVVPIIVSPQRAVKDKQGKDSLVFDCCMNPKVLILGAQDPGIKVLVNETSIELVEDSTGLALDRNYSLPKMKQKGELFATEFSPADFNKRPKEVGEIELGGAVRTASGGPPAAPGGFSALGSSGITEIAPQAAPRIEVLEEVATNHTLAPFRGQWAGDPPSHVVHLPAQFETFRTRGSEILCGSDRVQAPGFIVKAEGKRHGNETSVYIWT